MKKLWKDRWRWYAYAIFLLFLSSIFLILPVLVKWNSFLKTPLSNRLSFIPLAIISLFCIISVLSHKLSYVTKEGIHVGNVTRDDHIERMMKRLRVFVPWKEIKKIKIIKKKTKRSYGIMDFVSTLQVIPKKGKILECYINDIAGFTKALKSAGKSALLASDSYTGPSTTDIPLKDLFHSKYWWLLVRVIIGALVIAGVWLTLRLIFKV